jgi:hypothetical protein
MELDATDQVRTKPTSALEALTDRALQEVSGQIETCFGVPAEFVRVDRVGAFSSEVTIDGVRFRFRAARWAEVMLASGQPEHGAFSSADRACSGQVGVDKRCEVCGVSRGADHVVRWWGWLGAGVRWGLHDVSCRTCTRHERRRDPG